MSNNTESACVTNIVTAVTGNNPALAVKAEQNAKYLLELKKRGIRYKLGEPDPETRVLGNQGLYFVFSKKPTPDQ